MKLSQLLIVLLSLYLLYMLYNCVSNKSVESYSDFPFDKVNQETVPISEGETVKTVERSAPMAYGGDSSSLDLSNQDDAHIAMSNCGNKTQFISTNLLPKDDPKMEDASEFAPQLDGKNFVDSYKYVFGSQSQSLRNANYQLRSDPPNPQQNVCPWLQTTIKPEVRRQLDIGAGN